MSWSLEFDALSASPWWRDRSLVKLTVTLRPTDSEQEPRTVTRIYEVPEI